MENVPLTVFDTHSSQNFQCLFTLNHLCDNGASEILGDAIDCRDNVLIELVVRENSLQMSH